MIRRRQHFLQRTVLGVRFLVKLEAPLYFILFYLRSQDELANVASLCVVSPRASVACRLFCNLVDCRSFALLSTTRVRLLLVPNTDALSTTRVRLDAIPRLFPGYVAFRPAVSTNLPSTQHKLSTNSLQTQPFVSLSASAEDELSTQCRSDNHRDRRLMR